MKCPFCGFNLFTRNGVSNSGKTRWKCRSCHRETVNPVSGGDDEQESYTQISTNTSTTNAGNVLVISDLHFPYEHPKALRFCSDLKKEYNCTTTVFIGDVFDFSGFSTHVKDPDGMASGQEVRHAKAGIKEWAAEFPEVRACVGNHEMRLQKRFKEVGIPKEFLPTFNAVMGLPETWGWGFHHDINSVRYMHGNRSGQYLHAQLPREYMQCVVHGHTHSSSGVQYMSTDSTLVWGMNVGCLIDTHSYAFEYARDFSRRPVLGAGVVLDSGKLPLFVPLNL